MTIKTASVLAFERKLDPSDALLHAGQWAEMAMGDRWRPIAVREKSVRGTISNRLSAKAQDPAKLDAEIRNANLQTVDVAALGADTDTLRLTFTLRVLRGSGSPSACNDPDYREKLRQTVDGYVHAHGFSELAQRYASNLANARFLWRNRLGAEQVQVQVEQFSNGRPENRWVFNALDFSLRNFDVPTTATSDVQALAQVISNGLSGVASHVLLHVSAFARVGAGQEVFPSQELILDKGQSGKSKTLYSVEGIAAMHSQKIGNAIRTIDTWHGDVGEVGPIAVEPYGSVTTLGKACRQPKDKMDFYNLLDNWLIRDKIPAIDQQHFVMATLVRGGVFGESGK